MSDVKPSLNQVSNLIYYLKKDYRFEKYNLDSGKLMKDGQGIMPLSEYMDFKSCWHHNRMEDYQEGGIKKPGAYSLLRKWGL